MSTGTTDNNQRLITFLKKAKTDGDSDAHNVFFNKGALKVWGTWDGAKVDVYFATPLGDDVEIVGTADYGTAQLTKDTVIVLDNIVQNESIYLKVSTAGASTSLSATLQRI